MTPKEGAAILQEIAGYDLDSIKVLLARAHAEIIALGEEEKARELAARLEEIEARGVDAIRDIGQCHAASEKSDLYRLLLNTTGFIASQQSASLRVKAVSETNSANAKPKGENPIHDRIERLGRQAAFDHEPHEIVRTVRRGLRASEKLSERQVRRVLQNRGVLQKRTRRR